MLSIFGLSLCFVVANANLSPFFQLGEKVFRFKADDEPTEMAIYRLPENTMPRSYELRIVPNLEGNFNFSGEVYIDIFVKSSTNKIILHSKKLNITEVKLVRGYRQMQTDFELDPKDELLIITASTVLVDNTHYKIVIKYFGFLNDDMIGLYRSSYVIGNETIWLATTQFQATYARMAFPCYDEPEFKTPFTIHIARNATQVSISNMPLLNTSEPDPLVNNRLWDTFEVSPPMPTYLVAFVIFQMSYITDSQRNFVVWTRENLINDGLYAQKEGQKLLKQMEIFTGIPYVLPKMDLVALPDFVAGAMENWGLNVYRERFLLYNYEVYPEQSAHLVLQTLAHELSHQWFGNYVTLKWWDYLWLNEAFATYFEYMLITQVNKSWRMDEYMVVDCVQNSLSVDEIYIHHAMTHTVETPTEIENLFDFITYDKGASVVRMLEHIVTKSTFQKALVKYLNRGYEIGGTVAPDNLWDAFDEQIYEDKISLPPSTSIITIMNYWTINRGYPLIKVTRESGDVKIQQETYKSPQASDPPPDQQWYVPLSYTKKSAANFNNTKPTKWLLPNDSLTLRDEVTSDEWILFNIQQTGYYRVNYDANNWDLLVTQLMSNYTEIHVLNRAQLVDDSFSLAQDEKLLFQVPFTLATYLNEEKDIIPWISALKIFKEIYERYAVTDIEPLVKGYILDRIIPEYRNIGFDVQKKDDHLTKIIRPFIVRLACKLGFAECLNDVKNEYDKCADNLSKVQVDLKAVVYCTTLKNSNNSSIWDDLWNLYERSEIIPEREMILISLGCTQDEDLLLKYLIKLMDFQKSGLRKQDDVFVYRSVLGNTKGITVALKFIENNLQNLSYISSENIELLSGFLRKLRYISTTVEQQELIKKLHVKAQELDDKFLSLKIAVESALNGSELYYKETIRRLEEIKTAIESTIGMSTSSPPTTTTNSTSSPSTDHTNPTTQLPSSAIWIKYSFTIGLTTLISAVLPKYVFFNR